MSSVLFNPKGLFFETKTWEKVGIFGLKNLDARGQSPTTECQDCQLSSWKLQGLYDQNLCYLGKTWLAFSKMTRTSVYFSTLQSTEVERTISYQASMCLFGGIVHPSAYHYVLYNSVVG